MLQLASPHSLAARDGSPQPVPDTPSIPEREHVASWFDGFSGAHLAVSVMKASQLSSRSSRTRFATLIVLAYCVIGVVGCSTTGYVGDRDTPRCGNVFVVRGLVGYWPQVERLAADLRQQGLCPVVVYGAERKRLAVKIHEARCEGRLSGPVVLAGYSLGANDAIKLAKDLGNRGIDVDALILVDPTYYDSIPGNVRYCYNLYQSRPSTDWMPLFRGVPVTPAHPDTCLVNYDVRDHDKCRHYDTLNHFTICSSPAVLAHVSGQICSWCPLTDDEYDESDGINTP